MKAACEAAGVEFLCSAFSTRAVERLERIGVSRYKVGSGEVTNLDLVRAAAATGKPVLLTSGMSSWAELDAAVAAAGDQVMRTFIVPSGVDNTSIKAEYVAGVLRLRVPKPEQAKPRRITISGDRDVIDVPSARESVGATSS